MKQEELIFFSSYNTLWRKLAVAERALKRMPQSRMSPCALWVQSQMPFFIRQMRMLHRSRHFASRLPKGEKDVCLLEAARETVFSETGVLKSERVVRVFRKWQKPAGKEEQVPRGNWTLSEMEFLEYALRRALLEKAAEWMAHCVRECRDYREAGRCIAAYAKGKTISLPKDSGGLDMMLRILQDEKRETLRDGLLSEIKKQYPDAEKTVRGVRENRLWVQERIRETAESLKGLVRMDFMAIQEEICPVFRELRKHQGFMQMDRESRRAYACMAARVGKEYWIDEWEAARAAVVLSMGGKKEAGDPGYYLMEHPEEIGVYCGTARQVRKKDAQSLLRILMAAEIVPALFLGSLLCLLGMPLFLLPCFTVAAGNTFHFLLMPFARRLFPVHPVPFLSPKWGMDRKKVLIAVPVVLKGRRHFLQMARRMLVLYHACGNENVEFLLLCDLPISAHRRNAGDEEILEMVPAALDALNSQTKKRPFHILLRDRKWHKQSGWYAGQGGVAGAIRMLCGMIASGSTEEPICFCSFSDASLHRRYDYVITLEEDMFLPAGMTEKWVGAMCHPLQNGRVGILVPQIGIRGGKKADGFSGCGFVRQLLGIGDYTGSGILDPYLVHERLKEAPESASEQAAVMGAFCRSLLMEKGFVIRERRGMHPLSGWLQEQMEESVRIGGMTRIFRMDENPDYLRYRLFAELRKTLQPLCSTVLVLFASAGIFPVALLFAWPWGEKRALLQAVLQPQQALLRLKGFWQGMRSDDSIGNHEARMDAVFLQPAGLLVSAILLGALVLFFSLNGDGFLPAAAWGAAWVFSPLLRWVWELPGGKQRNIPAAEETFFRGLARESWQFFDAFVTESSHYLPPDEVQLLPNAGLCRQTSPASMAMYLLACISARELKLSGSEELGERMHQTLSVMEKLPRYQGLFYHAYDTETLEVRDDLVLARDAGLMGMALLCTAQALRAHLSQLRPAYRNLPERLDRMFDEMAFEKLYDSREKLFYTSLRAGKPSKKHCDILMNETLLLSFAALCAGKVSRNQMRNLNRTCIQTGSGFAPLSVYGGLNEYLTPFLLLPLGEHSWLRKGVLSAVRAQMSFLPDRPWGIGESRSAEFDGEMRYRKRRFGLPFLSENGQSDWQVVSPALSLLATPFFPRAVFRNVMRMEKRGWKSLYGFLEAVDFTPARLEKSPRMVWCHTAEHQGMVLCGLCNALQHDALILHTSRIPRVESMLHVLETLPRGSLVRSGRTGSVKRGGKEKEYGMQRPARTFAVRDAWVTGFHGNAMVLDQQGYGVTVTGEIQWTVFTGEAGTACGQQISILNRQTGEVMCPAHGKTVFESGAAVFETGDGMLRAVEKRTLAPMTGVQITLITLSQQSAVPLDVEIESVMAVSLQRVGSDRADVFDVSRPDERVVIMRRLDKEGDWMLAQSVAGNAGTLNMEVRGNLLTVQIGVTVPPRGQRALALITLAGKGEKEIEKAFAAYGDIRRAEESISLSRAGDLWYARECGVDGDMQGLYGRLLGACFFFAQPHQMCLPPPAEGIPINGTAPMITVQCMECVDRVLISHVLRFRKWLCLQGVRVDVSILLPREKMTAISVTETVKHILDEAGETAEEAAKSGLYVHTFRTGEETQVLRRSRLVLVGGVALEKQLDQLEMAEMPPVLLQDAPLRPGTETDEQNEGMNIENGHIRRKTGHWDAFEHMLTGKNAALLACDHGPKACFTAEMKPLTSPVNGGTCRAGEQLLVKMNDRVYDAWCGEAVYEIAAVSITAHMDNLAVRTELFPDPEESRTYRRVTLRAEEDVQLQVCWRVHLTLGEMAEYTRLFRRGGAAAAVNGALPFTGYAVTNAPDVQAVVQGLSVWFDCVVALKGGESQTLIMEVGCVRDVLKVPLSAQNRDCAQLLHSQRSHWQKRLQRLQIYTMEPILDRMINLWMPCLTETALRVSDFENREGWVRCVFAAWCCALTEPDRAWQILWSCEERVPDIECRFFMCYVRMRMCLITGNREYLANAGMLADFRMGPNGLPLDETGQESVRLAFMYVILLRKMALCCNEEESMQLHQQAADMLKTARQSWNGSWFNRYRENTGDAVPADVMTQCLAAVAGAPVRQARLGMEQAYGLYMQNAEIWDGMTAALLIGALVVIDEEEKGWQVFRGLIPDNGALLRENMHAFRTLGPESYAALLFFLLGIDKRGDSIALQPAVTGMPEKEVTVIYRYGEGVYHLTCSNTCFMTTLDGKKQEKRHVPLSSEKGTHEARFPNWKVS
ncbi:MAG: DUF3131 domain-containing protein [Clostridia bacterium]|nr:DUF3131 domain-containing protein [Clostridia bacterium]